MSAQKPDAEAIHNPWRTQIENILAGTNYLRGAEWQELLEDLDGLYVKAARITQLEAENAELQKNAARYLWLRDQHWVEPEAKFRLELSDTMDASQYEREIDAAIDVVIAQATGSAS